MVIDYSKIGKRITAARIKNGMTQEQLAIKSKLSLSYLRRVEAGSIDAKIPGLLRIASALNTTLDDFFCDCYTNQNIEDDVKELKDLLDSCSKYDRNVILELAIAMKAVLKNRPKDV